MKKIDINGLKVKAISSISITNNSCLEVDLKDVELERLFEELIGNFGLDELIKYLCKATIEDITQIEK